MSRHVSIQFIRILVQQLFLGNSLNCSCTLIIHEMETLLDNCPKKKTLNPDAGAVPAIVMVYLAIPGKFSNITFAIICFLSIYNLKIRMA